MRHWFAIGSIVIAAALSACATETTPQTADASVPTCRHEMQTGSNFTRRGPCQTAESADGARNGAFDQMREEQQRRGPRQFEPKPGG